MQGPYCTNCHSFAKRHRAALSMSAFTRDQRPLRYLAIPAPSYRSRSFPWRYLLRQSCLSGFRLQTEEFRPSKSAPRHRCRCGSQRHCRAVGLTLSRGCLAHPGWKRIPGRLRSRGLALYRIAYETEERIQSTTSASEIELRTEVSCNGHRAPERW